MAGWNDSERRLSLPLNWEALRLEQLKLDGWRCTWILSGSKQRCPRKATDVDHKREGHPELNTPGRDLQSLCAVHHTKKTAWAAYQAKRAKARKRLRPAEKHPGTLP